MSAKMHLISLLIHSPISYTSMTWMNKKDRQLKGLSSFEYWQSLARTIEKGCFDSVFFADVPVARGDQKHHRDASIRHGVAWPAHDPMPLVAVMASVTSRLGFSVTLSLNGTPPFLAVRRLSTLDYLSQGRVGWNIVTGATNAEAVAVGASSLMPHDERYDFADEYMDACYALWNGIEDGALLQDQATGLFADPDKVHMVDYKGKYLNCQAIPPTMPSAQGRPVLFQAGSSGRGMAFAIKHADVVYALGATIPSMKAFIARFESARQAADRPDPMKVMFGVLPIIGATEEDAKRRVRELEDRVPLEASLARVSAVIGVDCTKFDPDSPFEALPTQASQGMMATMTDHVDGRPPTLREVGARASISMGLMQLPGTPEQIADRMEYIWRETGCHGFNIAGTISPSSMEDMVEHVIPLLQKRGIFRTEYEGETLRQNLNC